MIAGLIETLLSRTTSEGVLLVQFCLVLIAALLAISLGAAIVLFIGREASRRKAGRDQ